VILRGTVRSADDDGHAVIGVPPDTEVRLPLAALEPDGDRAL
jgi:hypothetical protein